MYLGSDCQSVVYIICITRLDHMPPGHTLIFRRIWSSKHSLGKLHPEVPDGKTALTKAIRSSRLLFVMFVIFVVCWTPYATLLYLFWITETHFQWKRIYLSQCWHILTPAQIFIHTWYLKVVFDTSFSHYFFETLG